MRAVLLRRTGSAADGWVRSEQTGKGGRNSGTLEDIIDADDKVVLVVPGCDTTVVQVDLPPLGTRDLGRAIPFAAEELIASDPEDTFYATQRIDRGRVELRCVMRGKLAAYLGTIKAAGAECVQVITDWDLLHAGPVGELRVWSEDKLAWVRGPGVVPVCLERADAAVVVEALVSSGEYECIRIYGETGWLPEMTIEQAQEPPVDWTNAYRAAPDLRNLDLITSGTDANRGTSRTPSWRVALLVFVLGCVSMGGAAALTLSSLERERDNWDKRSVQAYREAFPQETRTPDVRRQLMVKLRARGNSTNSVRNDASLNLLQISSRTISEVPSATIRMLRFASGQLSISISAGSLAAINTLRDKLANERVEVRLKDAVVTQAGATGTLVLRAGQ